MCSCLILQNEYEASWEFGSIFSPEHEPACFYACVKAGTLVSQHLAQWLAPGRGSENVC